MTIDIQSIGKNGKAASVKLAHAPTVQKNKFLDCLSEMLIEKMDLILKANEEDYSASQGTLSSFMLDRLKLTKERIEGIARGVQNVKNLPDPIGEVFDSSVTPDGLTLHKERIPIGVIAVIYESRPNVTIDSAALLVKSGNAAILRGGKETIRTNSVFISLIQESLQKADLPADCVQAILSPDHALVGELLQMDEYINMLIPRGGAKLHDFCRKNSRIPVITGGIGVCHLYVDESADLTKCLPVIENAKVQRPTVCNALEILLVNQKIAEKFIPMVCSYLAKDGVEFRGDAETCEILNRASLPDVKFAPAAENDFDHEWLSLVLSIHIVPDLDHAIEHIRLHGTNHSDGILTETEEHARRFTSEVNSAAVYVNSSTRFTDGGCFGLGAEIAISTQPLHARGPMGLKELTTYKWVASGNYSIRK